MKFTLLAIVFMGLIYLNSASLSYIDYHGDKLVQRFNAYVYWLLTKSMDSHHLGHGRREK